MASATVICPECARSLVLLPDGRLPKHAKYAPGVETRACEGSLTAPSGNVAA